MGGIASWAIAEAVGKATLLLKVPEALSPPEERVRLSGIIPWAAFGKASLAAAAAAVSVFVLRVVSERAWVDLPPGFMWRVLPLAVAGTLFGVGYLTVLWFAGVRPTQMLAALRRRRAAA